MLPTITVDVGTTGVKLCLFDSLGALTASARQPTPTLFDEFGEIYDVPALHALLEEFVLGLDADVRRDVQRIAFTGVGESGGLVRSDLSLASPMILWHDHRGAGFLSRLTSTDRTRHDVYAITGLPINANYGLSKVAWAIEQAQRTGAALGDAQWLNVSDYLAASLTGVRRSEYSLASRTLALDLRTRTWSAEMAGLVGLDTSVFPTLHAATDGAPLSAAMAARLRLSPEVEVHVAGHDHMVGAIGAGLRPGELLNSTGTTEGLLFVDDAPSLDEASSDAKLANGIGCTGDDFTLFASIPTGGSAFATLQGLLGIDSEEMGGRIESLHERYLDGSYLPSSAPLVLPRFRGSPPPTKDARALGIVAGIGSDITDDDLVFGTFLGMALQFRDVLELFPEHPEIVKVIGPAGRNPLWLQLKADLVGTPLSVSTFPEVVSRGAQLLAAGQVERDAADTVWQATAPRDVVVDPRRHTELSDWYDDVRPLWEHLKSSPTIRTKAQQ